MDHFVNPAAGIADKVGLDGSRPLPQFIERPGVQEIGIESRRGQMPDDDNFRFTQQGVVESAMTDSRQSRFGRLIPPPSFQSANSLNGSEDGELRRAPGADQRQ